MGTYNVPRNVKGEGRILFIFSTKALIYTLAGGGAIGFPIYYILNMVGLTMIGVIIMAIFALLGFGIGTIKIPDTTAFEVTKKTGGENIDDIIIRWFKFKKNKNKIYIYKEKTEDKKGAEIK